MTSKQSSGYQYGRQISSGSQFERQTPRNQTEWHDSRRRRDCGDEGKWQRVRCVQNHLSEHKRLQVKDAAAVKQLFMDAIPHCCFCSSLKPQEIEDLSEAAEYFEFDAEETIIKRGDQGRFFFVIASGVVEVSVKGVAQNSLARGDSFGGIALLHNCTHTATVIAKEEVGLWGVQGEVFRRTLFSYNTYRENRMLLDCVGIFKDLSPKVKDRLSEISLVLARYGLGARVVTKGESATALYVVRGGELSVMSGGSVDAHGKLVDATVACTIGGGECFGWQAVLYNDYQSHTVVAKNDCELVCVALKDLKKVLGTDLEKLLITSFLIFVLGQLPLISKLPQSQLHTIANAIDIRRLKPGERVATNEATHLLKVIAVVDGELAGYNPKTRTMCCLKRGDAVSDDTLVQLSAEVSNNTVKTNYGIPLDLFAGPHGASIALLSTAHLETALSQLRISGLGGAIEAVGYEHLLAFLKKVPILRSLPESYMKAIMENLGNKQFSQNAQVVRQGESGTQFYIIASGSVRVKVDGKVVHKYGKGMCFGERALLYANEARTATCEVVSETAELWALDRSAFCKIVTGDMMRQLAVRLELQDRHVELKDLRHVHLAGVGRHGSVRVVEHLRKRVKYALKRIPKKRGMVPERVLREQEVLSHLANDEHMFIVHLVRTFETPKSVYSLVELVPGGPLREAMEMLSQLRDLKQQQIGFYTAQILLALEALHEKHVVHRDINPSNIMLDAQGYVKLAGFGVAKKLQAANGRATTLVGTPHYMSPEVIRGRGYGFECDVWSLGVTLFELEFGRVPFGDGVQDQTEIFAKILDYPPEYPGNFKDTIFNCKDLIEALLNKTQHYRLGAGKEGLEEVKKHNFFLLLYDGQLFNKVMTREIVPPIVPGENYPDDDELSKKVSLSDSEELGDAGQQRPAGHVRTYVRTASSVRARTQL